MPHTSAKDGQLLADLVLDNTLQLSGRVSTLFDGRLRLDNVDVLAISDVEPATPIQPDSYGTLTIAEANVAGTGLDPVRVNISGTIEMGLTLEFTHAQRTLASRYRDAIAGVSVARAHAINETATGTDALNMASTSTQISDTESTGARFVEHVAGNTTSTVPGEHQTALLQSVTLQSQTELSRALNLFFADLADHCKARALKHRADLVIKNTSSIICQKQGHLTDDVMHTVKQFFSELTPDADSDHLWQYSIGTNEELDIIDQQEFEDFLAIERIVANGEDLHNVPLEALTVRFATLLAASPDDVRLPIHVRQICRAFQRTLAEAEVPRQNMPDIFDYFGRQFISQLGGYYRPLNELLAQRGVNPTVETDITTKGSMLKRKRSSLRKHTAIRDQNSVAETTGEKLITSSENGSARDEQHRQLGEQLTHAVGDINPGELFSSVIGALNFKREAEGLLDRHSLSSGVALSGTWDGATVPSAQVDQSKLTDAQSIARVLTDLQHNSDARGDVQQSKSLRAYLAEHRGEIGELRNSSGLTAESLNQLDLVDNLFCTIKTKADVSPDLKQSLGNLQIPLTKLALLDEKFFLDCSHAARAVIDKLSVLAASGNFPNKALEDRINHIVDTIVADYESDNAVFQFSLEQIDLLIKQQERTMTRNIDRVIRVQEGQQRLEEARRAVQLALSERIKSPRAPRVLCDLIENGWRDLMVLTHVREGDKSESWYEQIKALDLLCFWLNQRLQGAKAKELIAQRLEEARPILKLLGQQISTALPVSMIHEELLDEIRDILAGNLDVGLTDFNEKDWAAAPDARDLRAKIEDLPRLRRWVKRVEQLEVNSWLNYFDDDGQKKRMQLAWMSKEKNRFIFVNERGQKVSDMSVIRLARQLSRGMQPPSPSSSEKLSVVDQSMYQTLEHVQKTLSFDRNHDKLTRLINRDTIYNQIKRALRHSHSKRSQHAVLYINIDDFHLVNEVYDRVVGDQILLEFARLLAQLNGRKSSSARLDGDEFIVLLLDHTIEQAQRVAARICGDISSGSVDIDGENVSFTVSIGVAAIREHSSGVQEVTNAARSAMQHAKQEGRNRVVLYEEDHAKISDYRNQKSRTQQDLEDAIASERFILRAQPIKQTVLSDRSISTLHYEILLGVVNSDGSLCPPGDFIQSAERYGFMTLIDRWVVRESFKWISQLMDEQKVLPHLSINLSGASVTDDTFMEYLLEQISEFGVGTSRLCFEITEAGTISNLVKAADFVRAFRNIGCKFSIDDFGTGLASHVYLRELPVDYVKIDGSFITGIDTNRSDYAMARSINDLAHFLGQETIAESVETDSIIAKLEELGVDYIQGWGVGYPKPLAEVTDDISNLEK